MHGVVIRVYDAAGNVIETHEHRGDFKEVLADQRACKYCVSWTSRSERRYEIVGYGGPIAKYRCSPLGLAPT